jgi:hypothetical protein
MNWGGVILTDKRVGRALEQWKHNRAFLGVIPPTFNDWIITATFYTALHAVEALLSADGTPDHSKHGLRHRVLQSSPRYDKIYPSYEVLYNLAHVTRYTAQPRLWTSPEDLEPRVFERGLYPVEAEVRRLLAELKDPVIMMEHQPIVLKQ